MIGCPDCCGGARVAVVAWKHCCLCRGTGQIPDRRAPVSEWISCDDRKPERGLEVLLTGKHGTVMAMWGGDKWARDDGVAWLKYQEWDFWMPIPPAPEEQNND